MVFVVALLMVIEVMMDGRSGRSVRVVGRKKEQERQKILYIVSRSASSPLYSTRREGAGQEMHTATMQQRTS